MLVGGGVENAVRAVGLEHAVQARRVGDAGEHRHHIDGRMRVRDLVVNEVERAFGAIEQQQPAGVEAGDLAHQLGTDRATCARHENDFTRELGRDVLHVELDRWPPQQVFHLDVADLIDLRLVGRQEVDLRRQDLDRDTGLRRAGDQRAQHFR